MLYNLRPSVFLHLETAVEFLSDIRSLGEIHHALDIIVYHVQRLNSLFGFGTWFAREGSQALLFVFNSTMCFIYLFRRQN